MYIEKFLNTCNEKHLKEFANNCGYELKKFIICDNADCIKVALYNPKLNVVYNYALFDYHIEETAGFQSMGSNENMPMVQKEWRKYLKSKFGNFYVKHFNAWLDNQKLTFENGNRR